MPADRARRAWRTLLWGFALFVLAQVTIGLLLDYRWPLLRFREASFNLTALSTAPGGADVLVLGSSRLRGAIDGEVASELLRAEWGLTQPVNVRNLAVAGGDPVAMEYLIALADAQGHRPRLVVLEVGPDLLTWQHDFFYHHAGRQLTWPQLVPHLPEIAAGTSQHKILGRRLFPIYYQRDELLDACWPGDPLPWRVEDIPPSITTRSPLPHAERPDWAALTRAPDVAMTPALAAAIADSARTCAQRWLRDPRIAGSRPAAVDRILRLCRQRGARVLLVAAPATRPYARRMTPQCEAEFAAFICSRLEEYDAEFLDARDWVADALFVDHVHLGPAGGRYFTHLFAHRALLPRRDVIMAERR